MSAALFVAASAFADPAKDWEPEKKGWEIEPIMSLQVLGGQNFYGTQTPSLTGDAAGLFAPAVKINDQWSLLPSLSSDYIGTRQVLQIVGGGTLFRSEWDNDAQLKALYVPQGSAWKLKPFFSFKYDMLQETNDEPLGRGLYDYNQWDLGLDAEYVYLDPFAVRLGFDYYQVHFPNYTSLQSQAATQFQGASIAQELVGDYVLDSHNVLLSASADAPLWRALIAEGRLGLLYAYYPRQYVVDPAGAGTSALRQDVTTFIGAGLKRPWQLGEKTKALASFDLDYLYDSSNQNSFDASQTQYIPYFYNYGELKLSPGFKLFVGPEKTPIVWQLSGSLWWRRYPHRNIQDVNGAYLGSDLYTDNWMIQTSLAYPISAHFNLLFNAQYGQATSNEQYQELYQYTFTTATYMFGFSYDL